MVYLDYASDDIVIFHGYFGLFVYDLNSLQIVRSLDLETINCHYTQGDSTVMSGSYSYHGVRFDTGELGYLNTSDWTLRTLNYIRDDMLYALFGL